MGIPRGPTSFSQDSPILPPFSPHPREPIARKTPCETSSFRANEWPLFKVGRVKSERGQAGEAPSAPLSDCHLPKVFLCCRSELSAALADQSTGIFQCRTYESKVARTLVPRHASQKNDRGQPPSLNPRSSPGVSIVALLCRSRLMTAQWNLVRRKNQGSEPPGVRIPSGPLIPSHRAQMLLGALATSQPESIVEVVFFLPIRMRWSSFSRESFLSCKTSLR